MSDSTQKLLTKAATRKALHISRAKYEQFIEEGILPAPVALTKGARPMHCEKHVRIAERNLDERMMREYHALEKKRIENGWKPIKPLDPNKNYTNLRGKKL